MNGLFISFSCSFHWEIFLYGFISRVQVWLLAKGKLNRGDQIGARIWSWFKFSIAQAKVIKKPLAGWMHFFLFWGFFVLFMAAGLDAFHNMFKWPHVEGALLILISQHLSTSLASLQR
jgi:hypothetical protein